MRVFPKFLISALSPEQFPVPTVPEVAFLGRSNVGKSSLINALLGSKQAKVSSTPGRTRSINFFSITDSPERQQPQLFFADLPGYGYAKISKSISSEWPKFIDPYLPSAKRWPCASAWSTAIFLRRRVTRSCWSFCAACSAGSWWSVPRLTGSQAMRA